MPKLDILLINPGGFRERVYQNLSENLSAIEPPFWAALTSNYLERNGFNVEILDANAENLTPKKIAEKIEKYDPKFIDFVLYGQHPSASTVLMPCAEETSKEIKNKFGKAGPKIIFSGPHVSALPEETLSNENIDFAIQGEGFYTLRDILSGREYDDIHGLWWKERNNVRHNERALNIPNLGRELRGVSWSKLPMNKYLSHNWHCFNDLDSRQSYAALSTTLGCPFRCDFCCINSPFGGPSYREWGPEWTLKQLETLVEDFGVKNLKIIDELFVLKEKHFLPIAQGIIDRGYNLNIWAYSRIDTVKEKNLEILKKAGFNWLGIGIESGKEEVRKGVSKGKFNQGDITDIVQKIQSFDINVAANYIFGLPEDTEESMKQTLKMAKELNCEWANLYCAMAYPGSQLHVQNRGRGILPEERSIGWIGYSQHSYETSPLPTKNLTPEEVLRFRDKAFEEYFTNPSYLKMIENKFGLNVKEHIEKMTKIKLKRKILGG